MVTGCHIYCKYQPHELTQAIENCSDLGIVSTYQRVAHPSVALSSHIGGLLTG